MYKNIIFDIYGTMIDVWTDEGDIATWQAIAPLLDFYGAKLLPEQVKVMFFEGCQKQLANGKKRHDYPEIDVAKVFYDILASQGIKNKATAKFVTQAFRVASTKKLQLFDGVIETLTKLKQSGKKLYVLSNAQASFTKNELAKLGLPKFFSGIVLSSNYGIAKPSTQFFDVVVDKYHLDKSKSIYIGNDLNSDIWGANNANMHCIWLNTGHLQNNGVAKATYTIEDGDFTKICDIVL